MSQAVNVNFKLDADVKKSMEQACSELGLSMSAAFTVFAKKVGREKRIPFEVSVDPFYSDSNIRYLENIVRVPDHPARHASGNNIYTTRMTLFGKIPVIRYVCCNCGYVENWVEDAQELDEIKKTFG